MSNMHQRAKFHQNRRHLEFYLNLWSMYAQSDPRVGNIYLRTEFHANTRDKIRCAGVQFGLISDTW